MRGTPGTSLPRILIWLLLGLVPGVLASGCSGCGDGDGDDADAGELADAGDAGGDDGDAGGEDDAGGGGDDAGPGVDGGPGMDGGPGDGGGMDGGAMDGAMGSDGGDADGGTDAGPGRTCYSVDPTVASNQVDTTLTVLGTELESDVTVKIVDVDTSAETDLGTATVASDGMSATVTLGMGDAAQGFYTVVVVFSDGTEIACGSLQVTSTDPPTVTDVVPDTAYNGAPGDGVLSDRTVSVFGTGFQITPAVIFVLRSSPSVRFGALSVNWISETELSATVPSESLSMPAGTYDVYVVNPDGLSAQWLLSDGVTPGDFIVTDVAPPTILSISPIRSPAADDVTLTVTGLDFQSGAVVSIEIAPGTFVSLSTTFVDASELTASIPGGTLDIGLYPVYVTNPDGQFDVYYAYSATDSSTAHLDPFEETGVELLTGRWRHATEIGFDAFAKSYLFVTGGLDGAGATLGDTEILEVSPLGGLSRPRQSVQWESATSPRVVNALNTPRSAHTLVRAGRFLFAVGGATANTHVASPADVQLDTVERAKILDYTEMPGIRLPRALGGSGLPIGTWYYQVSALGPWGESLPSREVQILRGGGGIEICWATVTGATGYNLYRSPASDGRSGTTRLVTTELAGPCVTDTGRGEFQPAPGRVRGRVVTGTGLDLGIWTYRVTAVVGGEETVAGYRTNVTLDTTGDQQVELRWDPVVGGTYNVYRTLDASTSVTGQEETFLIASGLTDELLVDDGLTADTDTPAPDGIAPLPTGSISLWETLTETMNEQREGLDGLVITVPSGSASVDDRTLLYVTGGRSSSAADTPYLRSTEYAEVDTVTGDISAFTLDSHLLNTPRGFYPLLTNVGQHEARRPDPPDEPPCIDMDGDGELAVSCGGCDCDDTDPTIHCGATELCGDGIDQDCDGADEACACPVDADGDGEDIPECGGCDCDDSDDTILCGIPENCTDTPSLCGDGIDQNCDGADCSCACPVDADGDGEDIPACGGCDCDDSDDTILCGIPESCTDTPELCDDGVDQNCDGSDCTCIIIFSGDLPGSFAWSWPGAIPWSDPAGIGDLPRGYTLPYFPEGSHHSVASGQVLLIAVAGDDEYFNAAGTNNVGLTTFEVTEISTANDGTNGQLLGWTTQTEALPFGRRTLGLDALLYFDHMFSFVAVDQERRETPSITVQNSAAGRFGFDETSSGANYVDRFENTSTTFVTYRAYYSVNRVNGGLFLVGGHDGGGPVTMIERTIP